MQIENQRYFDPSQGAKPGIPSGLIGGALNGLATAGTLKALIARVEVQAEQIRSIGHKLADHANEVHGPGGENCNTTDALPARSGLIGKLQDALDDLERAHSFVAEQAGRNCTLV